MPMSENPPNISDYPASPQLDLDDPVVQHKLPRGRSYQSFQNFQSRNSSPVRNNLDTHVLSQRLSIDTNSPQLPPAHLASESIQQRDFEPCRPLPNTKSMSMLSLHEVKGEEEGTLVSEKIYNLQKVDPFFTDSTELYYKKYEKMLETLNANTSEKQLCIEDYLNKSEKDWFNRFHNAKMGTSRPASPDSDTDASSVERGRMISASDESRNLYAILGEDYVPPTGLRKFLQYKIGDWPVYTFLLALGQIIAANSYQITLITGQIGQSAEQLYIIASIYLGSTLVWWTLFRTIKSVYVLSIPFLFYGMAFFLLGVAPFSKTSRAQGWIQNVATGVYALASASGSLFFALDFGSEGGTSSRTWTFRACVVQGTQQIYISVLWYWGSNLTKMNASGASRGQLSLSASKLVGVTTVIALFLWTVGVCLFLGLPKYYRSTAAVVPSFYSSAYRRKIIPWFLIVTLIQNYFLATPTGRNWQYLWSSVVAPSWSIVILLLGFFVFVWALALWTLGRLSATHSWIFPIFAIGLGAPRWCQMLWGTSGVGLYLPWAEVAQGTASGAVVGRALWLWLGVLDSLQGVGFGMILLQTLTRIHIAFTLMAAQVLGSVATIVGRATAPDKDGPGTIFPNLAMGLDGLTKPTFWVCLILQLCCCVGFFLFFRKEQLFKP